MNENIRKAFLGLLERLSENCDYQGRITKVDTKFSVHSLAAFLTYYALNSSGLNGEGKEYLLNGTELFSLLNSSSIGLEEIWNLIEIINTNSYISVSSQKKYVIPPFSIDMNREGASLPFEEYDWNNVGKLVQELEKSYQSKISISKDEFVVDLNRVLEDINKMLVLFKKSKIDQSHIDRTVNKTKPQECSSVLKKLYNVLGFECEDEENSLYHGLNDINKGFVEQEKRGKSDYDFDIYEQNNSLSLGLTKYIEELRTEKEIEDKNIDDDESSSSKSDNDSENIDNHGLTCDKKEFDSESEGLDNSDADIDYFEDVPGDVSDIKYKDFYKDLDDNQLGNREINPMNDMSEIDDEISSEENDFTEHHELEESKSAFELKEEKKKRKITELEEDLLKSKPWTLQGEVDAAQRPFNSLLEEVVEVDLSQRPPPVITKKRTKKLHNIICEIILNKSFDDVQKKQRPVNDVNEFKNKIALDQEKSKLSLAQIYEKEYLKEMENKSTEEKEETESAEKKEIRELMHSVTTKLQALSNLHFIPKPAVPELRIVSNLPAVAVEEIAPIVTSHDKLLAPEEITGTSKRQALDKEERTATDKKRERRKKKLLQKHRAKRADKNTNFISTPGKKHNKNTEAQNQSSDLKQLKTSKTFFDHLQQRQEVNTKLSKSSEVQNNSKLKKNKKRNPDGNSGRIEPKKIKL